MSHQKLSFLARMNRKNGLDLWCGQVEGRFLEKETQIVVFKWHESRACAAHTQEIGRMCHYLRRKGSRFLEWWNLRFKNLNNVFSFSSKTYFVCMWNALCVGDFSSDYTQKWVDGWTDTLITILNGRSADVIVLCRMSSAQEPAKKKKMRAFVWKKMKAEWKKIWSKFINFIKAIANVITDLLTRFQNIWTIGLSLKFAQEWF